MYKLWPLDNSIEGEDRNIPDWILLYVWEKMVEENNDKQVFYAGHISNQDQWLSFIKSPRNFVVFVMDEKARTCVAVAWLNQVDIGSAMAHFCVLGPYHRGIGEIVMAYWTAFKNQDGSRLLNVIYGITPETHSAALKLLDLLRWIRIGSIPKLCYLAYEERFVSGILSYYDFQEPVSDVEKPNRKKKGGPKWEVEEKVVEKVVEVIR